MKLYPKLEHISTNKLSDYNKSYTHHKYIFSDEGFFELDQNNLYKLFVNDIPIENFNINNETFILDKSYFKKDLHYQIPFHHIIVPIQKTYYQINEKANLSFIIEYQPETREIVDFYFYFGKYTKDNNYLDSFIIQEDILAFLSHLK